MNRIWRTIGVAWCLAVWANWAAAAEHDAPRTVTLAGTVIDLGTGKPAPNVALAAWAQGADGAYSDYIQSTTDSNGKFQMTVRQGARVQFQWHRGAGDHPWIDDDWLQKGNWQPIRPIVANQDRADLLLRARLIPTRPLRGRVVDDRGAAVAGATIHINQWMQPPATDPQGNFTLPQAPADREFDLIAVRESKGFIGFTTRRMLGGVARVRKGDESVTITVSTARNCDGIVTNGAGLPAPNLNFTLMPRLGAGWLHQHNQAVTTDADGRFAVRNLIPGAVYHISWNPAHERNRDYDYGSAVVDLAKLKEGDPIRFVARQHINALMGRVVDERGQPIKDARVAVRNTALLPQDARHQTSITTDNNGQFVIERLAAGTAQLHIEAPGYAGRQDQVPSDSVDYTATLKKAGGACDYRLVVRDDTAQPIKNARLEIVRRETGGSALQTAGEQITTDDQGQATVQLPFSQRHSEWAGVVICDIEGHDLALAPLPWNTDATIELVTRKSGPPWSGRIVDEQGKPLPGADVRVSLLGSGQADERQMFVGDMTGALARRLGLLVKSDAEGRFALHRLGVWQTSSVSISLPGFVESHEAFGGESPANPNDRTITLLRAGSIKGKLVLKATGQTPPGDGNLALIIQGSSRQHYISVRKDWTFFIDGLAADEYRVSIQSGGGAANKYVCAGQPTAEVKAGAAASLTVEVEEGIRIHGTLVDATGKAVSGNVMLSAGDSYPQTHTRPDGTWELYVPEGEYRVQYYVQGMPNWQSVKTVRAQRGQALDPIVIEARPQ